MLMICFFTFSLSACGSWSDDKHRAKRFNEETANVMLNNINAYRDDKNKADLEIQ